jgi:EF-P beta-lysylation protein EpmB
MSKITNIATWQVELSQAVNSLDELLALLELDPNQLQANWQATRDFPLRVPRCFIAKMRKGDPHDPLLRQVLPLHAELLQVPGFTSDPLAEKQANPLPGLIHKYHGRVLLTAVGSCSINCRYCFRRHFAYADNNPGRAGWDKAMAYIAADSSIKEVILSGGDPLVANDDYLRLLSHKIAAIPHVNTLRIHTRLPMVLPARITEGLVSLLAELPLQVVLVTHCNHANEIDAKVEHALARLRAASICLLNQTVLLQAVNDSVEVLAELSQRLFSQGVLPYYLHLLDKVQGTAHFEVAEQRALELVRKLQALLPGYLVPRLVREEPGKPNKVWVSEATR